MSTSSSTAVELSDNAERFRLLIDSVVDYGIFMLDPKGVVISWNVGAQRIKGYAGAEIIGQHFSVFYTQEARDVQWPTRELEMAARDGRFEDEGWRVRKDGSRFWANVVITALRSPDGKLVGFGKVTRDLTERRLHEDALRAERGALPPAGRKRAATTRFSCSSPDGIIESWNTGAQLIKGYAAAEVIGRHFSMFYRPEDLKADQPQPSWRRRWPTAAPRKKAGACARTARLFWANVVISPVFDAEKQLRGFAKVTRDMTERRRLEELESSSKRMNEFLAMLAHELRNPLAPIRNAVTMLQLEPVAQPGGAQQPRHDRPPAVAHDAAGGRPARRRPHDHRQDQSQEGTHPLQRGGGPRPRRPRGRLSMRASIASPRTSGRRQSM